MTVLVTWNIQCGRGVDGAVDLARIARTVQAEGAPDIVCFQEVARDMPSDDGGVTGDQAAELAALFPGYEATFGPAVDRWAPDGQRAQFGNLLLARYPVLEIVHHPLPQPAEAGIPHMLRQAIEVTVGAPGGPFRVVTTHLEFHSHRQRWAQVDRLRARHAEVWANARSAPAGAPPGSPYAQAVCSPSAVLCGDFNATPADPLYHRVLTGFDDDTPALLDAWPVCHPDRTHAATCGVHARQQWPDGPDCRDYMFVTRDLANRVTALDVDQTTAASDHQPVRLVLEDLA